jgi:hypothetical protein
MTHDPQAREAGRHPAPAPGQGPGQHGHGPDVSTLGEAIANHLFSAALDLHFALMVAGEGVVTPRLRHAVGQLDEAVKDLRHLMLAIPRQAAAPADGDSGSPPQ